MRCLFLVTLYFTCNPTEKWLRMKGFFVPGELPKLKNVKVFTKVSDVKCQVRSQAGVQVRKTNMEDKVWVKMGLMRKNNHVCVLGMSVFKHVSESIFMSNINVIPLHWLKNWRNPKTKDQIDLYILSFFTHTHFNTFNQLLTQRKN